MFKNLISRAAQIGADPMDDEDIRLRKSLLVICAFPFAIAGIAWGLLYILVQEPLSASIPLGYSVFSLLSILQFGITRRYKFFRFSQLALILLLPFLLMLSLGGFILGSAVILWSLICPLGAMLFDKTDHAYRWLLAFLVLIIISGVLQPYLQTSNHLSSNEIIFFFIINFTGVGSLVVLMVSYFVGEKNIFQEKSETLLLNILPKEIVAILRFNPRTIADHYDGASILFADVVNFTPLSVTLAPVEMVELLNEVFSHFDTLVEKYGLEKIKTIGDNYMVASGVPRLRKDHAQSITRMALEIMDYVDHNEIRGHKLAFRIGINSGPVVAGVIGHKKFIYDLWGDAVNTASRMESYGKAGAIQIASATYELIKDDFICESQGILNVKGKGNMEVWHVISEGKGKS